MTFRTITQHQTTSPVHQTFRTKKTSEKKKNYESNWHSTRLVMRNYSNSSKKMELQNKVDLEKQKKEQWEEAISRIQKMQESTKAEHEKQLHTIQEMVHKLAPAEGTNTDQLVEKTQRTNTGQ